MTKRIIFFLAVGIPSLAAALWFPSIPQPSVRTVVVLGHMPANDRIFEGLRRGLAERGWRETETIRFVEPAPAADGAALAEQARRLIGPHTALVVALSTRTALAARDSAAAAGVPLLLAPASAPMASGLVDGMVHPGQAVTGITLATQEARRLELLKRLAPKVRRVWLPHDGADPATAAMLPLLTRTAAKLELTLVAADIRTPTHLHDALGALPRDMDAIFVPQDATMTANARTILTTANELGIPVTMPHREGVALGALFSYGFDMTSLGRQAARLADQILSGTPANDLPLETAELDMTINLAVADRLGLVVPDDLLRHSIILGQAGE